MSSEPTEGPAQDLEEHDEAGDSGEARSRVFELEEELAGALRERDKAIAARDALLREVLPLAVGSTPEVDPARRRRWRLLVVIVVLLGAVGLLVRHMARTARKLGDRRPQGRVFRPRHASGARPVPASAARKASASRPRPAQVAVRPRQVAIISVSDVTVVGRVALDPTGRRVAIGGLGGHVVVHDLRTDRVLRRFRAHTGAVRALVFVDRQRLATAGQDGRVLLWSYARPSKPRVLRKEGAPLRALAAGGGWLAAAGEQPEIALYRVVGAKIGAPPKVLRGHQGWVRALAIDRTGRILASGGHDMKIRIWDVASGKVKKTLAGHRLWVGALRLDPAGKKLASAGFDKRTRIWDVATGKLLHSLRGHVRRVAALAFDATGSSLASASLDRTVAIWDVAKGRLRGRFRGHRYQVTSVAFAPGDQFLLTASSDGTVRLWGARLPVPRIWRRLSKPRQGELTLRGNTSGERVRIRLVDKKGKALKSGRKALARMLRSGPDDRELLPDKKLVELLYRTASHFGRQREIVVISGYRSKQFNALRTKQSKQVAKDSRHLRGQAIDFRISGVAITTLHRFLKKKRWGGVGLYPDSNFVHLDVGPFRLWQGN